MVCFCAPEIPHLAQNSFPRYYPSYPRFDRLHYRGPDIRRPPAVQQADLSTHQRVTLVVSVDEKRHRRETNEEGSR